MTGAVDQAGRRDYLYQLWANVLVDADDFRAQRCAWRRDGEGERHVHGRSTGHKLSGEVAVAIAPSLTPTQLIVLIRNGSTASEGRKTAPYRSSRSMHLLLAGSGQRVRRQVEGCQGVVFSAKEGSARNAAFWKEPLHISEKRASREMTTLDECKIADALTDIGSGPNVGCLTIWAPAPSTERKRSIRNPCRRLRAVRSVWTRYPPYPQTGALPTPPARITLQHALPASPLRKASASDERTPARRRHRNAQPSPALLRQRETHRPEKLHYVPENSHEFLSHW